LVVFDRGDEVTLQAGDEGIRFLLVSGKPLGEPVAWYGPIVMNTQEQLQQTFQELEHGTSSKPIPKARFLVGKAPGVMTDVAKHGLAKLGSVSRILSRLDKTVAWTLKVGKSATISLCNRSPGWTMRRLRS
jgi:hypothetical protein